MTGYAKELEEILANLDLQIQDMREEALSEAGRIYERTDMTVESFHGLIGGRNRDLGNIIHGQFAIPDDYFSTWVRNLRLKIAEVEQEQKVKYGSTYANTPFHKLRSLLKNQITFDYMKVYFERNFYRQWKERTRAKPSSNLWTLWFGDNNHDYGLLISPRLKEGKWENDVSAIRRSEFQYWTVGHALKTGLVDPSVDKIIKFDYFDSKNHSAGALTTFFESTLRKDIHHTYERPMLDRYLKYLRASVNPLSEPLLLPQLRYNGLKKHHDHRLDFTIFNSHTMEFIGIEFSPSSSHYSMKDITDPKTTQKSVNEELSKKWIKEMDKRRHFFSDFGITTLTFTEADLKDLDTVFASVEQYLKKRSAPRLSVAEELKQL